MTQLSFASLVRAEFRAQRHRLLLASLAAAMVAAASVLLLGLSGWFITGAALAGAAGPAAAKSFNYLLPSAAIRLLAIVRTAGRYGERVAGHDAGLKALAALRPALLLALARSRPERAMALSGGEAASRFIQDLDVLLSAFVRRSAPWSAAAAMAGGIGLAAFAGWKPALVVGVAMILAMLLGSAMARLLACGPASRQQAAIGVLADRFAALQAAVPELRCYGLEAWAADRVMQAGAAVAEAAEGTGRAASLVQAAQATLAGVAAVGAMTAAIGADLPLVALAGLTAAAAVEGAAALAMSMRQDGAVAEASRRLEHLTEEACGGLRLPTLLPNIGIRQAGMILRPGDRVAVVGASGAGKTTLVERLLGLRRVPEGTLSIGCVDLAQLDPACVRPFFSYCPQHVQILSGTVRDNLLLADPAAADADLWNVLGDACLDGRVRELPGGLDAPLGDSGVRLSGGEQRRLGLARAYLRQAPWLVLDEPTEGLDRNTEARVLERLAKRVSGKGQGLVMVTHSMAARAICHRSIAVIDGIPTRWGAPLVATA